MGIWNENIDTHKQNHFKKTQSKKQFRLRLKKKKIKTGIV